MSTPAPAYSLPPNAAHQETIDFLRRLSSMLTGGRNGEMLMEAANLIEILRRRATAAEQLLEDQQEEHARNLELREVAELASANLLAEAVSLRAEAESLKAEIELVKTRLDERRRQAEIERNQLAEETLRAQAIAEVSEARLAELNVELEELRRPAPAEAFDDSIAVVPVASLELARTQFDYLAKGFAHNGDVVSLTICEIGARAIDKALVGNQPVMESLDPPLSAKY